MARNNSTITKLVKRTEERLEALQENRSVRNALLAVLLLFLIVSTVVMFPSRQSTQFSNLKAGNVYTGKEIIAPFTFFIKKATEVLEEDRKRAAEQIPIVFVRNDSIEQASFKEFDDFFQSLASIRGMIGDDSLKALRIQDLLNNDGIIIEAGNIRMFLSQADGAKPPAGDSGMQPVTFPELQKNVRRILVDLFAIGVLNQNSDNIPPYVRKITAISEAGEVLQSLDDFHKLDDYKGVVLDKLRQSFPDQNDLVKVGYPIVTAFLQPNLIFDEKVTQDRIEQAVANVPLSKGIVLENERIVNKHELITPEILEKLNSLAETRAEKEKYEGGTKLVLPIVGRLLTVVLALSFTVMFVGLSRRPFLFDLKRVTMMVVIFVLTIGTAFFLIKLGVTAHPEFLVPISVASILITIFFDVRTAFISVVTLSIIIAAMFGNDFGLAVVLLFVGTMSTFSVKQIQARSWTLKGMLYVSGAYMFAIAAVELLKHTEFSELWDMWLLGLLNGTFSPFLAYGFMVIFEYVFRMTTNSTLLELSDLNKPLLRELAIRAPGTYHHSIMVGNLSEAAAEAIGANALLTRVASYYHDVGKMEKAEYFVENQKGGKNPHEKLAPSMSCLILINHVKKGLEIAEEYNLPVEIRDFIAQHHGTNIIRFFYQKALESSENGEVSESDFRYPGPRPQTKEAGIVMLADAIEAGSRTLKDPSTSRLRSMVRTFIQERLTESELDECPLTISDLNLIKESFVNTLTGMFHGRIDYPKQESRPVRKQAAKTIEV